MRALSFFSALALGLALAVPADALAQSVGVVGELEASQTTSPKEKLEFASNAVAEMSAVEQDIAALVKEAERQGDSLKVKCLNAKLAGVHALVEVSGTSQTAMQEALASSDPAAKERAEHEFRKIAVALTKVRQFQAEAQTCMADGAGADGSQVNVENALVSGDEAADTQADDDASTDVGTDAPTTSPFQ